MIVTDINFYKSFTDARTFCQGQGGYLATVKTAEEFAILAGTGECRKVSCKGLRLINFISNKKRK